MNIKHNTKKTLLSILGVMCVIFTYTTTTNALTPIYKQTNQMLKLNNSAAVWHGEVLPNQLYSYKGMVMMRVNINNGQAKNYDNSRYVGFAYKTFLNGNVRDNAIAFKTAEAAYQNARFGTSSRIYVEPSLQVFKGTNFSRFSKNLKTILTINNRNIEKVYVNSKEFKTWKYIRTFNAKLVDYYGYVYKPVESTDNIYYNSLDAAVDKSTVVVKNPVLTLSTPNPIFKQTQLIVKSTNHRTWSKDILGRNEEYVMYKGDLLIRGLYKNNEVKNYNNTSYNGYVYRDDARDYNAYKTPEAAYQNDRYGNGIRLYNNPFIYLFRNVNASNASRIRKQIITINNRKFEKIYVSNREFKIWKNPGVNQSDFIDYKGYAYKPVSLSGIIYYNTLDAAVDKDNAIRH